jgi:hypothetical protein
MALQQIEKAVDNMSIWADKINAGLTDIDAVQDDLGQTDSNVTTNTANIATNTADIATNTANIATNASDIAGLSTGVYQLDTTQTPVYQAGRIGYDTETLTALVDTGFAGVRVNVGQEVMIPFINRTGGTLSNGTVINAGGIDATTHHLSGIKCDISSPATSSAVIGIATADVVNDAVGIATYIGTVNDVDTSGVYNEGGVLYASTTPGEFSQDFPLYPNRVVILGTVREQDADTGKIFVTITPYSRAVGSRSYSFSQSNLGLGDYFFGGFYLHEDSAQTLSYGTPYLYPGLSGIAHSSHAFAVCSGVGTGVDTGTVGLKVTGTKIDDEGNTSTTGATPTADEIIFTDITDITTCNTHMYGETQAKWLGTPTYQLYASSGSPTTASFTFNVGMAKYDDLGNNDHTLLGFDSLLNPGFADSSFDFKIHLHAPLGWTYDASSFVPGNGTIAEWRGAHTGFTTLDPGTPLPWKRTNINQFIDGDSVGGILFSVKTTNANTVQSLDVHVTSVIEELV